MVAPGLLFGLMVRHHLVTTQQSAQDASFSFVMSMLIVALLGTVWPVLAPHAADVVLPGLDIDGFWPYASWF